MIASTIIGYVCGRVSFSTLTTCSTLRFEGGRGSISDALCTRAADAIAEVGVIDDHRPLDRRLDVHREILRWPLLSLIMGPEILSALARCGPSLLWGRPFL